MEDYPLSDSHHNTYGTDECFGITDNCHCAVLPYPSYMRGCAVEVVSRNLVFFLEMTYDGPFDPAIHNYKSPVLIQSPYTYTGVYSIFRREIPNDSINNNMSNEGINGTTIVEAQLNE